MQSIYAFSGGGTSSALYLPWRKHCKNKMNLIPLELPGRGYKENEKTLTSFEDMAEYLVNEITKNPLKEKYCFFGYCLGASLAYEVYTRLRELDVALPERLFLAGSTPPYVNEVPKSLFARTECREEIKTMFYRFFPKHLFPDKKSLEVVIGRYLDILFKTFDKYGEIRNIQIEELQLSDLNLDYKILKHILDFSNVFCLNFSIDQNAVIEYSMKKKKIDPIAAPITLFCGTEDTLISNNAKKEWQKWSLQPIEIIDIKANHFNLIEDEKKIIDIIFERMNYEK